MSTPTLHEHHIVQPKTYLLILIALLVLTATTTGVAFLDLGILNPIVALGDRLHQGGPGHSLLHASPLQLQIVEADPLLPGFFTFLVLITMTLTDYMSRAWGLW